MPIERAGTSCGSLVCSIGVGVALLISSGSSAQEISTLTAAGCGQLDVALQAKVEQARQAVAACTRDKSTELESAARGCGNDIACFSRAEKAIGVCPDPGCAFAYSCMLPGRAPEKGLTVFQACVSAEDALRCAVAGQLYESRRCRETASSVDPKIEKARREFEVAKAALANGNVDIAVRAFEEVVEAVPENSLAQYNLALLYDKKGWRTDAIDRLARARSLGLPEREQQAALELEGRIEYAKRAARVPEAPDKIVERLVGTWTGDVPSSGRYSDSGEPFTSEISGRLIVTATLGELRGLFDGSRTFHDRLGPQGAARTWTRYWRASLQLTANLDIGEFGQLNRSSLTFAVDSAEVRVDENPWERLPNATIKRTQVPVGETLSLNFQWDATSSTVFELKRPPSPDDTSPGGLESKLAAHVRGGEWGAAIAAAERLWRSSHTLFVVVDSLWALKKNSSGAIPMYLRWMRHGEEIIKNSPSNEAAGTLAGDIGVLCGTGGTKPIEGKQSGESLLPEVADECLAAFDVAVARSRDRGDGAPLDALHSSLSTTLLTAHRFQDYLNSYPSTASAIETRWPPKTDPSVLGEVIMQDIDYLSHCAPALVAQLAIGNKDEAAAIAALARRVISERRRQGFVARTRSMAHAAELRTEALDPMLASVAGPLASPTPSVATPNEAGPVAGKSRLGVTVKKYDPIDGLYVAEVTSGGPASTAGIQLGDFITQIDGKRVQTVADLNNIRDSWFPGQRVSVLVKSQRFVRDHGTDWRLFLVAVAPPQAAAPFEGIPTPAEAPIAPQRQVVYRTPGEKLSTYRYIRVVDPDPPFDKNGFAEQLLDKLRKDRSWIVVSGGDSSPRNETISCRISYDLGSFFTMKHSATLTFYDSDGQIVTSVDASSMSGGGPKDDVKRAINKAIEQVEATRVYRPGRP